MKAAPENANTSTSGFHPSQFTKTDEWPEPEIELAPFGCRVLWWLGCMGLCLLWWGGLIWIVTRAWGSQTTPP